MYNYDYAGIQVRLTGREPCKYDFVFVKIKQHSIIRLHSIYLLQKSKNVYCKITSHSLPMLTRNVLFSQSLLFKPLADNLFFLAD
jgi:hypothetical protein